MNEFFIDAVYTTMTGLLRLTRWSGVTKTVALIKSGDMNEVNSESLSYVKYRPQIIEVADIAARNALEARPHSVAFVRDTHEAFICDGLNWYKVNDVGIMFMPSNYIIIPQYTAGVTYPKDKVVVDGGVWYEAQTTTSSEPPADWDAVEVGDLFPVLL